MAFRYVQCNYTTYLACIQSPLKQIRRTPENPGELSHGGWEGFSVWTQGDKLEWSCCVGHRQMSAQRFWLLAVVRLSALPWNL